jgi:hypothetical protein
LDIADEKVRALFIKHYYDQLGVKIEITDEPEPLLRVTNEGAKEIRDLRFVGGPNDPPAPNPLPSNRSWEQPWTTDRDSLHLHGRVEGVVPDSFDWDIDL